MNEQRTHLDGDCLLTTQQAADFLGRPTRTLEDLRYRGGGPPFVKMGRAVRYRKKALLEWVLEREVDSTSSSWSDE